MTKWMLGCVVMLVVLCGLAAPVMAKPDGCCVCAGQQCPQPNVCTEDKVTATDCDAHCSQDKTQPCAGSRFMKGKSCAAGCNRVSPDVPKAKGGGR